MRLKNKALVLVAVLLATLMIFVAAGCGDVNLGGASGGKLGEVDLSGASFTVGSKDSTEQQILGYITVLGLEAAGAETKNRIPLASTDAARQALVNGEIDMYWEYTGTIWINFLGHTKPIPDSQKQYEAAAKEDLEKNNLKLLEPAPFNNTYALAIRKEAYDKIGVEKLSDLPELVKKSPDEATVCVDSEFSSRDDGLPGLEKAYRFQFPRGNASLFDSGVIYDRTDKGDPCNFGEVFTTDGRISALGLKVIEDDENFFPIYNPAVDVRKKTYDQYGEQLDQIFTPIAKALDTKTMTQLNRRVDVDGEFPKDVAESWLKQNGFID